MRICLLGQANPTAWMPHLVRAFSHFGDVLTIGPVPTSFPECARPWPTAGHIDVDFDRVDSLLSVMPTNWNPDLVVTVSGGGIPLLTRTHDLPCPTVFYSVDTWQCYMDYLEALHYDIVFAGQRAFVPLLRAAGSRHVYWLPLACDPEAHAPSDVPRSVDIAFVGGASKPVHWQRRELLRALSAHFSVRAEDGLFGKDLTAATCSGRLVFNHSAVQDVNMRIFESLAMGTALLTNRDAAASGLLDLFQDGVHLAVYDSRVDLVTRAQQLLADETACQRLRDAGRAEVLAHHTYVHRARTVLDTVASLCPPGAERSLRHDSLVKHLPRVPGRVLDWGMDADASKYSLARAGATGFAGLSSNSSRIQQRGRSYSETAQTMPTAWAGRFDSVILDSPSFSEQAINGAWDALIEGGSLISRLHHIANVDADINRWFWARNFHIVDSYVEANGSVLAVARKRTRRLRDIAAEVCDTLRVPGVEPEVIVPLLDPDW